MTSLENGTHELVASTLPPDYHTLHLTSVIVKQDSFEHRTSIIGVMVDVRDCIVKMCSDFFDTFQGIIITDSALTASKNVAIKRIRLDPTDNAMKYEVISALALAEDVWCSLSHPNICPTWSVTSSTKPMPAVAMPWFVNGNILEFMAKHPGVDQLAIIKQVANAVTLIHAMGQVHGNIVPTNILMTDGGMPCLSDVGLHSFLLKMRHRDAWPIPSGWMFKAPEELSPQCNPLVFSATKEMDVYAFASTAYNIFASRPPFPAHPYGRGVMEIIARGHILAQPGEITGQLWELLKECWAYNPHDRPSMAAVELALAAM